MPSDMSFRPLFIHCITSGLKIFIAKQLNPPPPLLVIEWWSPETKICTEMVIYDAPSVS